MKKGGGSESAIIIGPSKSVLVYALHSLEYVLPISGVRAKLIIIYMNEEGIKVSARLILVLTCSKSN